MKIMIVSDTHRNHDNLKLALEKEKPIDQMIHCGDSEGAEYIIEEIARCPLEIVLGNNDFFSDLEREKEFQIGKYKVWLTHGHSYGVAIGIERIKEEAIARGVDIVMFGHSHKPLVDISQNIIAVNPGSLSYPRQEGRKPSFVIMELDKEGEAHFQIQYL
ncbi:metallophosphoesterase [bacterium 1XD42-8]|jgi:putative phosphoesterase|nr:metallophosphoesterase [Lachnospiraceae bacterium]RKJ53122.1 metallophosphoesterase [bacterium 1XD42-8]